MLKSLNFISFLIPDFLDIQRSSFFYEFQKKNPILNKKKRIKILFFPKFYQLTAPKQNPDQAVIKSKTYASELYIPIQKIIC